MAEDAERPVFDQLNLVVADMEASTAFYRRLGLDLGDGSDPWAADHRTAQAEPTDFDLDSPAFAAAWGDIPPGRTGPVLGFRLASAAAVDAVWADLTGAGYTGQRAPYDAFWGARYAIVVDPDGNLVGLMGPVDPAKRSAPPST